MFYDSLLIQILMGGAATITFLGMLSLLGAVTTYIQAQATKIKTETAFLMATAKRIRPGKNGKSDV